MMDLRQALAEWGAAMGLPELQPGPQGTLQLRFADSGALLGVAEQDDCVVVHHAEPVAHDAAELLLRAMRQAAHVAEPAQAVQVGLRSTAAGDWLVLGIRIPHDELNGQRMHQAAQYLQQWLAQLPPASP